MALTFRDTESKASILTLRYHLFQFANPSKELLSTHSSLYGVRCLVKALKISKESGAKGSFMVVFHFRTCLSPGALGKAPDAGTPQGPTKGRQEAGEPPPIPLPSQAHACPSSVLWPRWHAAGGPPLPGCRPEVSPLCCNSEPQEDQMPLSAKGCLSPGPRGKHHILAEHGPDCHRQMSSATRSGRVLILRLIQKAAAAATPKLMTMLAACQLTAFTRQNGKSHGPCLSPETFRSNTQLSRRPQRLPHPRPADPQLSPRTCVLDRRSRRPPWWWLTTWSAPALPLWQDPGPPIFLEKFSPTCEISTYPCKKKKKKAGCI